MSAPAFTPGPWTAEGSGWEVRACDGQMKICDIRGWGYLTGKCARALPDDEAVAIQKANEALIAAAPELYEALESLLGAMTQPTCYDWEDISGALIGQAQIAIAKARGESSPHKDER